MWKQFLGKISRKSAKSGGGGSPPEKSPRGGANGAEAELKASPPPPATPAPATAGAETREDVFLRKLNICCVVFDFAAERGRDSPEVERKRQVLLSLVDCVSAAEEPLTEAMISACVRMFAINLFRVFPPKVRSLASDEDEPFFDPSWYHLQVVYELLLRFVMSPVVDVKVARKYMDNSFISRLLDLFDSDDPRERECLKSVLHRVYGKFMGNRPFIRKAVSNIFYRFVFETDHHNGIAELLEFIEKEPKLTGTVIRGLLKYWPVTNSQKEMMFLGELEEVLELTEMADFQKCAVPLFRRIAHCLNSSHFQVAERALFLWNNEHLFDLISQNRQVILPIIYPALERNARWHWNQSVLNVTMNVRKMFLDMDEKLLLACQSNFQEEEEKRAASEERRRLVWERLEKNAAFRSVTGDICFAVPPTPVPLVAPTMT
ncbi:hypothetical protein PR202_gb24695 [Eleusine coracana subsp. coracana]|uniref:Serine/threonine protein phosphatase 2A regulatory subunit n=1 Tax=Eleusine coracana subsp. coracana TaxID=191504 RepID=A0AAV5FLS3_ELECO|nr:hypothetical protein PR202_gb24695 [Eleusine coracana subsp. coracana]